MADRLDLDLLDEDQFEVDAQAAHLFKHPHLEPTPAAADRSDATRPLLASLTSTGGIDDQQPHVS